MENGEMTTSVIPGVEDTLLASVGQVVETLEDLELATFINCGSLWGRLDIYHCGYEKSRVLAEQYGDIRDDILECVKYWAMKRSSFREVAKSCSEGKV